MIRALLFILLSFSVTVQAKDLANRLGVGYADQVGIDGGLPSLAVRYFPSTELGLMATLGVDTQKNASKFAFGAKVFRIIFQEDNLNFYMGAGAGMVSREKTPGKNDSGFEVNGFGGAEFFFAGLDNLGFSFEAGVGVTSISSEVRFRTIGDSPFKAGVIFYF